MEQSTLPSSSDGPSLPSAAVEERSRKRIEDQRSASRIMIHANVTAESQDNFFSGIAENISQGGVFVSSFSPPPVGETVRLKLSVDGAGELVISGRVRWLRTEEDGTEIGCGVQFEGMAAAQKDRLMSLVSTLRRTPLLSNF